MPATGGLNLDAATIAQLHQALSSGELTALALAQAYVERIDTLDPLIGSVIALHPDALTDAATSDARRLEGRPPRALEGIPVLVKDNIAVAGLATTAGSRALAGSAPPDAPLVGRLRSAGAVILGKTNLSEWANFRDEHSTSGWSAVGGQTRNPHSLAHNPSGSSSGSAAAVAASLAQVTIGTETDGSIISPAGVCGVVGYKPARNAVPGEGIVPISSQQDTAGPMARNVADAALTYAILSATPPAELRPDALAGARIAVWRPVGSDDATDAVLDAALAAISASGAAVHDVEVDLGPFEASEWPALLTEFRHEIDAYLACAPGAAVGSLAELISFNESEPDELAHFGQSIFVQALAAPGLDDPAYREHRVGATKHARALLERVLAGADALVTLTNDPAWAIDYGTGDQYRIETTAPAAVAGYPSISVPAGFAGALPIGVSLVGRPGDETRLWQLAFSYEQATLARRPPGYLASVA